MFEYEDYVKMLDRIPPEDLKKELIEYFQVQKGVAEVRSVLKNFLSFYTRKR